MAPTSLHTASHRHSSAPLPKIPPPTGSGMRKRMRRMRRIRRKGGGRLVAPTPVAASHCKRMALSLRKQSAFIMSYQRGATSPPTPSSLLLQLLFSLVLPAPPLLHLLPLLPPPPLPLSPLYLLLLLSGSQEEESEQEVKV